MNKKVFIAQPMTGVREKEIEEIRKRITEQVKELFGEDVIILDQFHVEDDHDDIERVSGQSYGPGIYRLGRSLQIMAEADLVIFAGNSSQSKGCEVEKVICKVYNIKTMTASQLSILVNDARWLSDCIDFDEPFPNYGLVGSPAEEVIDNGDGTTTVIKR